jgi:hypothetical protein
MKWLVIPIVCLFLIIPALAAGSYPGERPADKHLLREVDVALSFWADRYVTGCPDGITATIADSLDDPAEPAEAHMVGIIAGRGGDCRIWVHADITTETRRALRRPKERIDALEQECALVVHEVRHALPGGNVGGIDGEGHSESGIMAAEDERMDVPWDCLVLARKVDRPLRRQERINREVRNAVRQGAGKR